VKGYLYGMRDKINKIYIKTDYRRLQTLGEKYEWKLPYVLVQMKIEVFRSNT
jgi:hypothetical protein